MKYTIKALKSYRYKKTHIKMAYSATVGFKGYKVDKDVHLFSLNGVTWKYEGNGKEVPFRLTRMLWDYLDYMNYIELLNRKDVV